MHRRRFRHSPSEPLTGGRRLLGTSPVQLTPTESNELLLKRLSSREEEENVISPKAKTATIHPPARPVTLEENEDEEEEVTGFSGKHPVLMLLIIFVSYLCLLFCVYLTFPDMKKEEKIHIKVPFNMKEAKALANVLENYKDEHYYTVLTGFFLLYIFLQSFAIPGSIFLSIISGFLFRFPIALFAVCFCSATGAGVCYLLSWLVARKLIRSHFPDEIREWTLKVREQEDNLLSFMLFLRITPILPNWFINITAPQIGVPLKTFWLGTFLGVLPPSVLAIQAGKTLNSMTTPTEYMSWGNILILGIIALCALIPVLLNQ